MNAVPIFERWRSRQNLQWYFRLKAPNNVIICKSDGYTTSSEQGVNRVKVYAPTEQSRLL